jgi:tetratricopeptide (TPR) repeat protein
MTVSHYQKEKDHYMQADELFEKAEKFIIVHDFPGAVSLLKQSITMNKNFSFAYIALSKVFFKLNRISDAIRTLEACISADPSFAYPHYLIAKYLYSEGKKDDAIKALKRATEIDHKNRLYSRALNILKKC